MNQTDDLSYKDSARETFLNSPLTPLIVRNAFPAVGAMLIMSLYQIVDGIMVGRRLGPEAIASVNIIYPVLAVFVALAAMIGAGGNARLANLLGAGDERGAGSVLSIIVLLGVITGISGTIFTLFAAHPLLLLLGTSGASEVMSGEYLHALAPFFLPMILSFIFEQSMRNDGRGFLATIVMVVLALLNIALDYVFLYIFDMGLGGAAYATGISHSLGACVFLGYFFRKMFLKKAGLRFRTPEKIRETVTITAANGFSEFFNNAAAGITIFLFNRNILRTVGLNGVAAFSLMQYISVVGLMFLLGLNNGVQPILSYNHGAGMTSRVRGTLLRLMTAGLCTGLLFWIILCFFSGPLIGLFIKEHPAVIELTIHVSRMVSWSMIPLCFGVIGSMYFTALEYAGTSLIISAARSLVFIVIGLFLLPPVLGTDGIWLTPLFSELLTAVLTVLLILLTNVSLTRTARQS